MRKPSQSSGHYCEDPRRERRRRSSSRSVRRYPLLWLRTHKAGSPLRLRTTWSTYLVGAVGISRSSKHQLPDQPADVRWMVADTKPFSDNLGHPRTRPHLSSKPVGRGSLGQPFFELCPLVLTQAGRCAGGGSLPQAFHSAPLPSPLHPLAYRPFGNAQCPVYLPLDPTLLPEFPGSEATTPSPIGSLTR